MNQHYSQEMPNQEKATSENEYLKTIVSKQLLLNGSDWYYEHYECGETPKH